MRTKQQTAIVMAAGQLAPVFEAYAPVCLDSTKYENVVIAIPL